MPTADSPWRAQGRLAVELAERIARWNHEQMELLRTALASFDPQLAEVDDPSLPQAAAPLAAAALAGLPGAGWKALAERLARIDGDLPEAAAELSDAERTSSAHAVAGWEQLLAAYDRGARRGRGAFFTPHSLARFVAESALRLLADVWSPETGRRRVVDPAAGSGALLQAALDADPALTCHELLGWESDPATAAAANTLLEPRNPELRGPVRWGDALVEADARPWFGPGGGRRRDALLVIGNPPYNNFGHSNRSPWILEQLRRYKQNLGERKHNLDDDFVKFFRWAEHHIAEIGCGVLALITNSTYLRGITHRLMRESLLTTFDQAWLLDLRGEQFNRAGSGDENLFDIRQGVAVSLMVRHGGRSRCRVRHAELTGARTAKLEALARGLDGLVWRELAPSPPDWLLVPRVEQADQYLDWSSLDELLPKFVSGVQSKCDRLFVDRCRERLATRIRAAIDSPHALDLPIWLASRLETAAFSDDHLRVCQVAPFDCRWMYYDPKLLGRSRHDVMRHVCHGSPALAFMRQSTNEGPYDHFLMCGGLATDRLFHSRHGAPYLAPRWLLQDGQRRVNLSDQAWRLTARDGAGSPPESVVDYIYAVAHASSYRRRFAEPLRQGFPRIPPAPRPEDFERLADLGARLAALHSGDADAQADGELPPAGPVDGRGPRDVDESGVTTVRWNASESWRLPTEAWNWRVGGVAVIPHWLRARRGESLSEAERRHLAGLPAVAAQTRALTNQIDDAAAGLASSWTRHP